MTLPPTPTKPAAIWQAYLGHRARLTHSVQPAVLCQFSETELAGIEARAAADPAGPIAAHHRTLLDLLQQPHLHADPAALERARALYRQAVRATFPAAASFLRHSQELADLTSNVSLTEVDLDLLRQIDLLAHDDATYRTFVADMVARLDATTATPDIVAYNQFFEIYAEAAVLHFLRGRKVRTSRVIDTGPAPDFECQLADGRSYFVEVKTLDIVGGATRHQQIMDAGVDVHVEIERQQRAGARIASASGEIAPYRKPHFDTGYDAYSLTRVIETLRDKCRQAFKPKQFKRGPTLALVVADRLILPGWKSALAPYYYDEFQSGACVSGVIWQAAFGKVGTPVLRQPEFEGKPSLEGYLTAPGLYVDDAMPFPGMGLVVLQTSNGQRVSYGLKAPGEDVAGWTCDDTEEALHALCGLAWNDQDNSHGFEFVRYTNQA